MLPPTQQIMYLAFGGGAFLIASAWYLTVTFGGLYAPIPSLVFAIWYNFVYLRPVPGDTAKYINFLSPSLEKLYGTVRAPPPSQAARGNRAASSAARCASRLCLVSATWLSRLLVAPAEQDPDLCALRVLR